MLNSIFKECVVKKYENDQISFLCNINMTTRDKQLEILLRDRNRQNATETSVPILPPFCNYKCQLCHHHFSLPIISPNNKTIPFEELAIGSLHMEMDVVSYHSSFIVGCFTDGKLALPQSLGFQLAIRRTRHSKSSPIIHSTPGFSPPLNR